MRYVILHNIRSRHNVGSIFRTADGAGISKIYLSGYTPTPIDRFGRVVEEIKKTSLGASEAIPYIHTETTEEAIALLREKGVSIVAVEQGIDAREYQDFVPEEEVAYIFGNETEGIPESILKMADSVIHIKMHGMKESLNVSVAAGIILFGTRSPLPRN